MQPGADEIDYRETPDVTRVHGAVKREHKEPEVGIVPVPVWWFAVVILVTFGAAFYFGQYGGGFSGDVYNESEGTRAGAAKAGGAVAGAEEAKVETLAEIGKKVFNQNCASCHQGTGLGIPGTYPPLAGSHWVNGPTKRLTALVLKGMQGPVEIEGKKYNGAMPAWGTNFNDKKMAAVLSYIRSSWGNTSAEITPEQVAVVRKEFASRAEPFSAPEVEAIAGDIEAAAAPAPAPAP